MILQKWSNPLICWTLYCLRVFKECTKAFLFEYSISLLFHHQMKISNKDNEGGNQLILQDLSGHHRFEWPFVISSRRVWSSCHVNMRPKRFLTSGTLLDVWPHYVIDKIGSVSLLLRPKWGFFCRRKKRYWLQLEKIRNNVPNSHVFLKSIASDGPLLTIP